MASWRIGYMVIPDSLWEAVNKIQDTIAICPPLVSQHVALAAIRVGAAYTRAQLPRLDALRRHVLATLGDATVPCDVPPAPGAFFYFLRVHTALDAMTMAERLIRERRIAVIPGSAFGAASGCYLRMSYGALDAETATEGIGRLAEGLRAIV
jgi:aspartate/methionine/tyrosine aminotransferase